MSYLRSYQEILDQIDSINPIEYAKTRNYLEGAVTRLSPYISRGVITLPQIRERVLSRYSEKDAEKLLQELAWREYFQNVWWEKVDDIFSDLRFPRHDWHHDELVTAILNADTGIAVMDEAIRNLYDTGYIHNHARLWLAAIATNIAGAHWHTMGKWLYYHLIDGDLASNFLSWQWVAGTSVAKRYTVNQDLINAWSTEQQHDTWLSLPREATLTMPIPEPLTMHEPFNFVMEYPVGTVETVSGADVCLYTPWTLSPEWRKDDECRRVLIFDSLWFDRYPISPDVRDFIVRQGQTVIPNLEVYSGYIDDLPGIYSASQLHLLNHQTNQHWPGHRDALERLYPSVTGYYPSFFAYWQAVQKQVS